MEIYFRVKFPYEFKMKSVVCKDEDHVVELLSQLPLYENYDAVSSRVLTKQTLDFDFGVPKVKGDWGYEEGEEKLVTHSVEVEPMLLYHKDHIEYVRDDYLAAKERNLKAHAEQEEKLLEVELEDDSD